MSKYDEMKQEAKEAIIECLKDGYSGYYCDLHNEVFNTDYYIIGTYEAEKALEAYGTFKAIREVKEYEEDNFGESYTDYSNPEKLVKLVNMLYYIIGEEVLRELFNDIEAWNENYNSRADGEINKALLAEIED